VHSLLALLANPEACAARIAELRARLVAAEEGITALAAEREPFDADIREGHAALVAEKDALVDRHVAVVEKRKTFEPRRSRISELYGSWRNIGESDFVCNGIQAPQLGDPLTKARRAYGKLPAPAAPAMVMGDGFERPEHWSQPAMASHDQQPSARPPATRAERRRAVRNGVA